MNSPTRLTLLTLALTISACTSFDRAATIWSPQNLKPAGGPLGLPPRTIAQSPFDGRWSGRWVSDKHHGLGGEGMSGKVWLVLTKYDPYRYRANVRAFWRIFRSDYEVFLDGHPRGNVLHLHGQVGAGIGGPFRYEGTVTPHRFVLSYDSPHDRGTVELTK
jgi:hypothetical protein